MGADFRGLLMDEMGGPREMKEGGGQPVTPHAVGGGLDRFWKFWEGGLVGDSLPNADKKKCTSMIMSSGVTIDQVYQEIKKIRADMVKREDLEALVDTVEILSNPATMQAIKKSDRDIHKGRVKSISSVDDLRNDRV